MGILGGQKIKSPGNVSKLRGPWNHTCRIRIDTPLRGSSPMDPLRQLELSNFAIMPSNCFLIMSLFNANVLLSARFSFPSFMSHEIITRFNMVNINYINSLLDTCLVPTQRKNVTIYRLFVRSNKESLHTHNTVV